MTMNAISAQVLAFIRETYPGAAAVDEHTLLFQGGIIDSLGMVELFAFLRSRFAVRIDPLVDSFEDFESVEKISALVVARRPST